MRVVITQSMLFPWVGMLEQVRLADVFVHLDDVQFSKGGFVNRVQIKTAAGPRWMTVPLRGLRLGTKIDEVTINDSLGWRELHLRTLAQEYAGAPFRGDMLRMVERVYEKGWRSIGALARASMMELADYFGLRERHFVDVNDLAVDGSSSARVLKIVQAIGGNVYVTGHGAAKYLDHGLFEAAGVRVEYMKYEMRSYPQLHGEFTPFVSGLDLVANCGRDGASVIAPTTVYWKEFVYGSA